MSGRRFVSNPWISTARACRSTSKERLEYHPSWLEVIENIEYVYACEDCEASVVSGSKPTQPIVKGLAGPGLLAYVLVSKYGDHLPQYRLERIFKRLGVALSRKTLCDWVGASAKILRPIVEEMKIALLASRIIHTDDTSVPVLDPSLGQTRKGRLWVYIGDKNHPYIVYDYTPSRERDGPAAFLKGYSGYLQADAYGAYDGIYAGGDVHEVACWMHARRYFYNAGQSDTGAPFTALAFIKQLYQIEDRAKDMNSEERHGFRQKHAVPVLDALKRWLDETFETVLPKSPLAQAMGYSLRQWDALKRYTEDGDLSIDNGESERRLRLVALGRKNWLFTGSDTGGEWAAVIYSIIETCKLHGVEPFAYLKDVFESIPSHPPDLMVELTPKAWAEAQNQELQAAA